MDDSRTQELLLELLQKVAVIEARLGVIEEIKLDAKVMNSRVDCIEAQNREHDKTIKSLEHRANEMEHFVRGNLNDSKKQQTGTFISLGIAVFSAVLSLLLRFV